jgi:PAS domain S-box-containing protein
MGKLANLVKHPTTLYLKLIEPHRKITDAEKRRRSQLQASLLMVVVVIEMFFTIPFFVLTPMTPNPLEDKRYWFVLPSIIINLFLLYLNAKGKVYLTTGVMIMLTAAVFIIYSATGTPHSELPALFYMILPTLLSSILLPFVFCLGIFALTMLFLVVYILILTGFNITYVNSPIILFNGVVGLLIIAVTVYRNILEKDRRQELMEKELQYRNLLELAFEGIMIHHKGKILEANNGLAIMFGYTSEEIKQVHLAELTHQSYHNILMDYYRMNKPEPLEVVGIKKDQSEFYVELIAKYQVWEGKRVRLVAMRDISDRKITEVSAKLAQQELERRVSERTTALAEANAQLTEEIERRKRIEAALKTSEEHFRLLFENSPIATYQTTPAGLLVTANQALVDMLGYESVEQIIGQEVTKLWVTPEERAEKIQTLNATGYLRNVELDLKHKNGAVITVLDNARLVESLDGTVFYEGSLVNITERKKSEQDVLRALKREKELNELKYNFITMASHNFRTPLSVVLSSAELLEHYSAGWSEDKKRQHLQNIQIAVNQLTEILDDFSAINTNDPELLNTIT